MTELLPEYTKLICNNDIYYKMHTSSPKIRVYNTIVAKTYTKKHTGTTNPDPIRQ